MKIPYYIVTIILMTVYLSWCLILLSLMITLVLVASSIAGYFAIQYKLISLRTTISRVVFLLLIIFLPIGFLIGWIGLFGALILGMFPKYLELALSGRLIPCIY